MDKKEKFAAAFLREKQIINKEFDLHYRKFLGLFDSPDVATGLCPLHEEQTPSFIVDFKKGKYQCFGCGVKGEVHA